MADDLGWGDTGYNGNSVVRTPHLDRMAREGIRFDRWYAGAPVCSPTRGNCLTGRHPLRYGIPTANAGHMLPGEATLAETLKREGYATGHFGKWHLGTLTTTLRDSNRGRPGDAAHFSPPWHNGFDVCFSTEAKVPTYDPMKKPRNVRDLRYGWKPVAGAQSDHYGTHYFDQSGTVITDNLQGDDSRVIMDRAIPFIRNAAEHERPFLCVIWFHAPHLPVVAGPKHAKLYAGRDWKDQMYYGCISALDEEMGRLRGELESLGIAGNTMLWFSSDNGPENGTPGSAGRLRARKRSLYEGGIRVPGLLVWPDRISQPRSTAAPCQTGDYYPTVLAAVGAKPPKDQPQPLDGINLLPLIDGEVQARRRPIMFSHRGQQAVVGDRYKLYRSQSDATWQLYDLVEDPGESDDLAGRDPDRVAEMASAFTRWQADQ